MRNDAHDELEHVPSLTTDPRDRDDYPASYPPPTLAPQGAARSYSQVGCRRGLGTGPLWVLVGALIIALGGLSWWSYQQIRLMEAQLVATQESFARISEEAAGRIQDISGKVVATESSVTTDSEALKLRAKQLETRLVELAKQQQMAAGQRGEQSQQLEQLATELNSQKSVSAGFDSRLETLANEQKSSQARVQDRLKELETDTAVLKKQGNPNIAIGRLEQDLLVLRSELDNRNNTVEFDAFRAQITRNINTLMAQMQNLQQQLNAHP